MMGEPLYAYPKLMKAGLCNMLEPWATCYLWSRDNGAKMIAPYWTKIRVGPYLRGERDKRNYQRLFHHGFQIAGVKRAYLLSTLKRVPIASYHGDQQHRGGVIVEFSGMGSFSSLIGRHTEVKRGLLSITKKKFVPEIGEKYPFIGIHVRLGDYPAAPDPKQPALNYRLPLEWYVSALREIRSTAGSTCEAVVFSDGSDSELKPLLSEPLVRRSQYRHAITDLLSLSDASVIIGSCSTFSMWAAFFAQTATVWHPGRCPGKVFDESTTPLKSIERAQNARFPETFGNEIIRCLLNGGNRRIKDNAD